MRCLLGLARLEQQPRPVLEAIGVIGIGLEQVVVGADRLGRFAFLLETQGLLIELPRLLGLRIRIAAGYCLGRQERGAKAQGPD